jgi:hypothetical protein
MVFGAGAIASALLFLEFNQSTNHGSNFVFSYLPLEIVLLVNS